MINGSKIILRDKSLADALDDYTWQTDPELAHLDAAPLPTITFREYLSDYTSQLRYLLSTRRQFAIDTLDGKHIGNCVYYGVNKTKGEAELGIMIGNSKYWNNGYGTDVVTTLLNYVFRETKLNRIYLKTLQSNTRAQQCFKKAGFIPCGRMVRDGFEFLLMEIHRRQWEEQHQFPEAKTLP